jgi:chorismate dehydratase
VEGLVDDEVPLDVRFDLPARCAQLLQTGQIDVGLIPSIEYLRRDDYAIVPGIAVASDGPVASVALFSHVPTDRIRSIALDTSSRTSATLLRVLCDERFQIAPVFEPCAPDLSSMVGCHDAALLIGDPALFADPDRLGLLKVDLGAEWQAHTGLPFVWALWAGPAPVLDEPLCDALTRARDRGVAAVDRIATDYARGDARIERIVAAYLRENVTHWLGDHHERALVRFFASAARLGLVPPAEELRFVGRSWHGAAR